MSQSQPQASWTYLFTTARTYTEVLIAYPLKYPPFVNFRCPQRRYCQLRLLALVVTFGTMGGGAAASDTSTYEPNRLPAPQTHWKGERTAFEELTKRSPFGYTKKRRSSVAKLGQSTSKPKENAA
jgi:hypothetical protein